MTMDIPIRNVWLLQFFASELFRTDGHGLVTAEDAPEHLPELVAKILAEEVTRRLRHGLSVGFRSVSGNDRRVRGRINQLHTECHQLLSRGQVNCTFDEIVTDIPSNRLIRAALERAAVLVPSDRRHRALALHLTMAGVRGLCPRLSEIPHLRSQRLLQRDRTMIAAAELLLTFAIPTTDAGDRVLPLPSTNDAYLRQLFEHAAFGIYRHHLSRKGWRVDHGSTQYWDVSELSDGMRSVLPGMRLDIVLEHPRPAGCRRRIVVDTKFTSVTKAGYYRTITLSSSYVYQIYAYLMSQANHEQDCLSEGLMLHPVVDGRFDEEVVIQGRRIRFATVDLTADGRKIADDFLAAITPRR
jgi:5-methylcytosine-specific restriction enzyme subunit McrC